VETIGLVLVLAGCDPLTVVRRRVVDALKQGAQQREDSPFGDLRRWWRDVTWLEPRLIAARRRGGDDARTVTTELFEACQITFR
jgi:hypothetical protein